MHPLARLPTVFFALAAVLVLAAALTAPWPFLELCMAWERRHRRQQLGAGVIGLHRPILLRPWSDKPCP
jgi:hypothetical protein